MGNEKRNKFLTYTNGPSKTESDFEKMIGLITSLEKSAKELRNVNLLLGIQDLKNSLYANSPTDKILRVTKKKIDEFSSLIEKMKQRQNTQ